VTLHTLIDMRPREHTEANAERIALLLSTNDPGWTYAVVGVLGSKRYSVAVSDDTLTLLGYF